MVDLGGRRLRLTDAQRRRLAVRGKAIGRRALDDGERSLRRATRDFVAHYHAEWNHQGLDNRLIEPGKCNGSDLGAIRCIERLGGMLRFYNRAVA